jgi:hypothetical protein
MPPRSKAKTESKEFDNLAARAAEQARAAGVEIEAEPYTLDWYREEWPARKRIFLEREIKIRNAFNRNRLQSLVLNDAQVELLEASLEASNDPSLEDYTLKCRRLGISTYYTADYLSDAIMEDGHHVRMVAQDPDTLRALFKALKEMYDNLRDEIRPRSKYSTKTELEFDDEEKGCTGSRITVSAVVPGQEEKGRGDTITRLHLTEIPFWRGDPETAAVALCDATKGGKISGESTAKGVGDWFHRKYVQGKLKQGGVRAHFFEWWWNRNYRIEGMRFAENADGEWFLLARGYSLSDLDDDALAAARVTTYTKAEREAQNLPLQSEKDCAEQILIHLKRHGYVETSATWTCDEVAACLAWRRNEIANKGAKKFRVEYPENDKDPFAQTGGTVFDQSYLEIKAEFRAPEPGHEYKIFLDPSNGIEGADPACITVHDCDTGEQVFEWDGYKKQDAQALHCCELSDLYNGAEIGIESNMGEAAILEVERLGYGHRLYKGIDAQTERDIRDGKITYQEALMRAKPGLAMTERVKRLVINDFEKDWRTGDFKCASPVLIQEAQVFVQDGERMGAKSGYHDDSIMANACCRYLVRNSRVGKASFKSAGQRLPSASARGF